MRVIVRSRLARGIVAVTVAVTLLMAAGTGPDSQTDSEAAWAPPAVGTPELGAHRSTGPENTIEAASLHPEGEGEPKLVPVSTGGDDARRTDSAEISDALNAADYPQGDDVFAADAETDEEPITADVVENVDVVVADAGVADDPTTEDTVEVPIAPVSRLLADENATLVNTVVTSSLSPPSPDSAGITYLSHRGSLLMSDSEVNEVAIFADVNLWELTLSGTKTDDGDTTPWSDEPTGVSFNPGNLHLYVSDDTGSTGIYDLDPGTDEVYGNSDDSVTHVSTSGFGSTDPEGVAYDPVSGDIFWVDGVDTDVYRIDPGPDGVLNGVDDTFLGSFDVGAFGAGDPEGIAHNPFNDTLMVLDSNSTNVYEVSKSGVFVRSIDTSASNASNEAGIVLAPPSSGSGNWNMYIVARGQDNGSNPDENDGRMYEMSYSSSGGGSGGSPPVAVNDPGEETDEDVEVIIDVADNDSDPDGNLDPSSAAPLNQPSFGTAVGNGDGTITYTPDPDMFGIDGFDYQICDLTLLCDTASVTVTVTAVDDPPVAVNDPGEETDEDVEVIIDVADNDSDPDGNLDPSSAAPLNQPSFGTAVGNGDGTITYTPDPDMFGIDGFDYQICDLTLLCDTASVTVTVTAVDDPPVAVNDPGEETDEDVEVIIDVADNDSDPDGNLDPSSAAPLNQPSFGTAVGNGDGTITYTPDPDMFGIDGFDYQICDLTLLCDTASVTVTVTAVDDPPVAVNDPGEETDEDVEVIIDVADNDSDPDGNLDPSSAAPLNQPSFGTAVGNGDGTITYTPDPDMFGIDGFDYQICDLTLLCDTASVTVTVTESGTTVNTFIDDDGSIFEADIEWMYARGITFGCPGVGPLYCPFDPVTRAQMASFLVRVFDLPAVEGNRFTDVGGVHTANINALAEAGITFGCNPGGTLFCPTLEVTRAQMGSFLARALGLTPISGDVFDDVADVHEGNINAIAALGITNGCNSGGTLFCPTDPVTRGQLAAFLHRALG